MSAATVRKNCTRCSKTVGTKAYAEKDDPDSVICESCWIQYFAPTCVGCLKPILTEYVMNEDKHYHPECYELTHSCKSCGKGIYGDAIGNNDKTIFWHPECFKCCACKGELESGYMEYNSNIWCPSCGKAEIIKKRKERRAARAPKPPTSQPPSEPPVATSTTPPTSTNKESTSSALPSVVERERQVTCKKCTKPVSKETAAFQYGSDESLCYYHEQCFKCTSCSKSLAIGPAVHELEFSLFCPACAKQKATTALANAATQSKGYCAECGKKIASTYLQIKGAKFHKNCFCCAKCSKTFGNQGYAEIDGRAWCAKCVQT